MLELEFAKFQSEDFDVKDAPYSGRTKMITTK